MALLIGTDEAGYGPSLGPLVITATKWECSHQESDLYHDLADVVTNSPREANAKGLPSRILIADSKAASRSGGLGSLELPVLVLLHAVYGNIPSTLPELVTLVMPDTSIDFLQSIFWLKDVQVSLPAAKLKCGPEKILQLSNRFKKVCCENKAELIEVRSAIVLPSEFNASVIKYGNKANLLSQSTLELILDFISGSEEDVLIECDKHGGRNYYGPLISKILTDQPVTPLVESPSRSAYRWMQESRPREIRFTPKGEEQLPVALASMVSKYLREVFMLAWNDFWKTHLPEIKPTKGYPQDAKRFLAEIKQVALAKGYSRKDYIRNC